MMEPFIAKTRKLMGTGLYTIATLLALGLGYNPALAVPSASEGMTIAAQGETATGKVTDSSGAGIMGAVVTVSGTDNGTMTNSDGTFFLSGVKMGSTLIISCLGYDEVDVEWDGRPVNVKLEKNEKETEESVVTALGIKRDKESLGYAVNEVSSKELMNNKSENAINSLSGKVAGLNVTQSSGAAGASSQIVLRGGTSGSAGRDNQPLFVVDGVLYDNSAQLTDEDGSGAFYNPASNLNPEDIENMSILKGPAAAALYGSRAANGVIIITTKKGQEGVVEVNLNSKFSLAWASHIPAQQAQWRRGFMEDMLNDDGSYAGTYYNDFSYDSWGDEISSSTPVYDNIGGFFRPAGTWDNNVSVSGGSKMGNFFLSASRYDQDGIVPKTGYNKTTFRFNGEQKFLRIFTLSVNTTYSMANTNRTLTSGGLYGSSGTGTLAAVYQWSPTDDMTIWKNEDGSRYRLFGDRLDPWDERDNPYWILNNNSYTDKNERFTGSINLHVDITKWWNVNYTVGIDTYDMTSSTKIAAGGAIKQAWQKGMISDNSLKYTYYSHNLMSNFSHSIGDFNGNLMLGLTTDDTRTDRNYKSAWNFTSSDFYSYANTSSDYTQFTHGATTKRLVGLFGEVRLDWKNTVFLSMTGRNDWSSTLPIENRSYFYPSVSASVVFTKLLQERGLMDFKYLSFGKLRASWAKVGKDTGAYETNTLLWPVGTFLGDKTGVGATWTRGNPYLKPEMSRSSEIGVELHFFQDRMKFDLAYYTNDSFNQIMSPRVSQATGYILCSINAGNVYNRGFELQLSGTPIQEKDFVWETGINMAHNKGTLDGLPEGMNAIYPSDTSYGVAKPASFSGGHFMAISGTEWLRTDDGLLILDKNGFPQESSSTSVEVGNRESKLTGGWNNTIFYKNLTFNMLWEFRIGGDVYNGTKYAMTVAGTSKFSGDVRNEPLTISGVTQVGEDSRGDPIYEATTNTWYPDEVYSFGGSYVTGYNIIKKYYTGAYNYETANWITNVNSLRLRSISVTYNLPKRILDKAKIIKRASVSASLGNILLFTNYDGDPEVAASSGGGGSSTVGFDYLGVPATRSCTFGVNLTF